MTIQHSAITDPNLHEPKGITTAAANSVYVANGAATGTWRGQLYTVSGRFTDISTAETIYLPIPYAGLCRRVTVTLGGAITAADSLVTPRNASGSAMETLTAAFTGSGAGSTFGVNTTTNNSFTDNSHIRVETDGASSTAATAWVTVVIERT